MLKLLEKYSVPLIISAWVLMMGVMSVNVIVSEALIEQEGATYEIVGIASTEALNSYDMIVEGRAFDDDIIKFNDGGYIPLLLNHTAKINSIIGKVTFLESSSEGILFRAIITADKTNQKVIDLIQGGYLIGVSIGFIPGRMENNHIVDLTLREISLVVLAADPGAHIISIRELK
jgi:HK97 family phage prohead protease